MSEISIPEPKRKPGKLARAVVATTVAVGGGFVAGKALNEKKTGAINPVKNNANVSQVEQPVGQEQVVKDVFLQRAYKYLHQGQEVDLYDVKIDPAKMSLNDQRQIELIFSPITGSLKGHQAFKNVAMEIVSSSIDPSQGSIKIEDSAFVPEWVVKGQNGPATEADSKIGFLPVLAGDLGITDLDTHNFYHGYIFLPVNLNEVVPGVEIDSSGKDVISEVRVQVRVLQNADTEQKVMGFVNPY